MTAGMRLHEQQALRRVTGPAIRPGGLEVTARALALMDLAPGSRVLDVGCGTGATVGHLRELGYRALGVDRSFLMLTGANSTRAAVADAMALPFAPGAFDAVFCECALCLTPDPGRALSEMHRVLEPGGMLAVSDLHARGRARLPSDMDVDTCLANMASLDEAVGRIEEAGLGIEFTEDLTIKLKELAARIIFEHGSLDAFWSGLVGCRGASCMAEHVARTRPGYHLIIARKVVKWTT